MPRMTPRQAAERIIQVLERAGHRALLAGGCVRDMLLGLEAKDYDVATDARPERVVELFRRTDQVGAKFGVVLVRIGGQQVEVATFRADGTYRDGRHPDEVRFGRDVDDARRRDFTINGMFYDVSAGEVIDHVGGGRDLEDGKIRAIGEPDQRFAEDRLRMLRAVRFATRLDFEIEGHTLAAIQRNAQLLPVISAERIRGELKMILEGAARARGWRLIVSCNLADHLLPGCALAPHAADIEARLADLPPEADFTVCLAVLLHHLTPAEAEYACRRLACANVESAGVSWLLTALPRVREAEALELADVKMLRADNRFAWLLHLLHADLTACAEPVTAFTRLRDSAASIPADKVAPAPLVTGEDLIQRGVPQGPVYSRVLDAVYRAQLNEQIQDRDQALRILERLINAPPPVQRP